LLPKQNATKFVHQCGVVVRDNIPISTPLWYKPANPEGVTYVSETAKNDLWDKLIAHFTLPVLDTIEETQKMTIKVKHFALKKMAEQFNKYKNKLYRQYVKDNKAPEFTGTLERQRAHWPAFLEYKDSEVAKERSAKNKENAAKKKYHHKLGPGGYRTAEPKWDQAEAAMRDKGITPATEAWPRRVRNWTLGHGVQYDMETGELAVDEKKTIAVAKKAIVEAIDDAQKGKFIADRENDELTVALGNKEKPGRTRGLGADTPWKLGFPEDIESYRSRERARKRKEQEEEDRLKKLEREQEKIIGIVRDQQKQLDEFRSQGATHQLQQDSQGGAPSQRRSSVASTGVGADEAPMDRYPVDDIREKTSCELHVGVRNLSLKAADGYALSCESTARWHCNPIPDGYGRVGVDRILPGYESLELDIPGAEDERTLGEVGGGIVLWRKKYIVFPGSAPRPPSSPPRRDSSPPTPHDDERDNQYHNTSPSRSPPHQPTPEPTPPPPPTKAQGQKGKRSPQKRKEPLPRVPPAPPKRPYDLTDEETAVIVAAEVKAHFAPRKPDEKQTFDPKTIRWAKDFIEQPSQIQMNLPDDYSRTLRRSASSHTTGSSSASGKRDVAQLGEQAKQSISPLKVLPTDQTIMSLAAEFAAEAGITLSQAMDGGADIPAYLDAPVWKWKYGKPLVPPNQIEHLPTKMRNLHEWYLRVTKKGRKVIPVKVTKDHFAGKDETQIYLEELFMLYKIDALDISLVSTYCL